ncbi:MAG: hypothetical protein R3C19_13115 [Planctomycetaceae bacterium]
MTAVTPGQIADVLQARGERDEAAELLHQAHAAAEHPGIPEASQIRSIQQRDGLEVVATDAR